MKQDRQVAIGGAAGVEPPDSAVDSDGTCEYRFNAYNFTRHALESGSTSEELDELRFKACIALPRWFPPDDRRSRRREARRSATSTPCSPRTATRPPCSMELDLDEIWVIWTVDVRGSVAQRLGRQLLPHAGAGGGRRLPARTEADQPRCSSRPRSRLRTTRSSTRSPATCHCTTCSRSRGAVRRRRRAGRSTTPAAYLRQAPATCGRSHELRRPAGPRATARSAWSSAQTCSAAPSTRRCGRRRRSSSPSMARSPRSSVPRAIDEHSALLERRGQQCAGRRPATDRARVDAAVQPDEQSCRHRAHLRRCTFTERRGCQIGAARREDDPRRPRRRPVGRDASRLDVTLRRACGARREPDGRDRPRDSCASR